MGSERGHTLTEMLMVLAVLGLLAGSAVLASSGVLVPVRTAEAAIQLRDSLRLVREQARAGVGFWRVAFHLDEGGDRLASAYEIQHCQDEVCTHVEETKVIHLPPGTGFRVKAPTLVYTAAGQIQAPGPEWLDLDVCRTARDAAGILRCHPDGPIRRVRLYRSTGLVEDLGHHRKEGDV